MVIIRSADATYITNDEEGDEYVKEYVSTAFTCFKERNCERYQHQARCDNHNVGVKVISPVIHLGVLLGIWRRWLHGSNRHIFSDYSLWN